jgi:hypothetical protein
MPWLVGIAADAFNLRWGLAIAAFTPLLMLVFSVLSVCAHPDLQFAGFHASIT